MHVNGLAAAARRHVAEELRVGDEDLTLTRHAVDEHRHVLEGARVGVVEQAPRRVAAVVRAKVLPEHRHRPPRVHGPYARRERDHAREREHLERQRLREPERCALPADEPAAVVVEHHRQRALTVALVRQVERQRAVERDDRRGAQQERRVDLGLDGEHRLLPLLVLRPDADVGREHRDLHHPAALHHAEEVRQRRRRRVVDWQHDEVDLEVGRDVAELADRD
mmetsp:Transcript_53479/g.125070  ORF Transcript_53479/g.125070 Transcript_53479/m.125070 type:complete len:223 (-) Transcript_53479:2585-3253(-)